MLLRILSKQKLLSWFWENGWPIKNLLIYRTLVPSKKLLQVVGFVGQSVGQSQLQLCLFPGGKNFSHTGEKNTSGDSGDADIVDGE